jgi:hypothetical protein
VRRAHVKPGYGRKSSVRTAHATARGSKARIRTIGLPDNFYVDFT